MRRRKLTRRAAGRLRVAALLACVTAGAGCNLLTLPFDAPTTFRPPTRPKCSPGGRGVAILLDAAIAVPALAAFASVHEEGGHPAVQLTYLITAIPFTAGVILGGIRQTRCHAAHRRYDDWRKAHPEEAQRALLPPPPRPR